MTWKTCHDHQVDYDDNDGMCPVCDMKVDLGAARIEIDRLRNLFGRYVAEVVACEGHDYLPSGEGAGFTAKEIAEIEGYCGQAQELLRTAVTQADAGAQAEGPVSD